MTVILDVAAADYHQDAIADTPTLSASVAKLLISSSPAHARAAHPRLNPNYERVEEDKFSVGTAAHAVLLEGRDIVSVVAAEDWRTNDAKALRDEIRTSGRIPLLNKQWAEVEAMCEAVREQLPRLDVDPAVLAAGKPEQTIVWEDHGVTCRALIDWLHDDYAAIDDFKTTKASANPRSWTKTLYGMNADLQVAFNVRAVKAATGVEPEFRFVVVETAPPFVVSVVGLAPSALALANDRMDRALAIWKRCLERDDWPGYDRRVHYVEMPGWLEYEWLEQDARESLEAA